MKNPHLFQSLDALCAQSYRARNNAAHLCNSSWPDARQYTQQRQSLRFMHNRYPRSQAMTLRDALLEASATISRRDAETLLVHVLQRDRAWLLAHTDDNLAAPE